jgi:4-amino-4-deoxy-L-arabinose transferase-like glycosyltransferase
MAGSKRWLIAILALAVAGRVAAALAMGNDVTSLPGTTDQLSYHALALRVLDGHGFSFGEPWWPATSANSPTAHWSYLYTFFLVAVYGVFGPVPLVARLLQAVAVGILQPWLAYQIGSRVFNPRTGLAAAAVTAVYIYFIYYAAALMTEAFFICAVLAVLLLGVKFEQRLASEPRAAGVPWRLALGLGLCAGAAVLLRQVFGLFLPVLFAWIFWRGWRRGLGRAHFVGLAAAGGLVAAMIVPFTIYNYLRFGQVVLLNTNAGFAFYWANHPVYGTHFDPFLSEANVNYFTVLPPELKDLNEAQMDQALLQRGLGFVVDDPVRYLKLSVSRIPIYFMFWPTAESSLISNLSRVGSFGLLLPFLLYGLVLAGLSLAAGRQPAGAAVGLLLVFAGIYTAIHVFSWTLVRYRLPIDAVFVVFAGLALADLAARLRPHWPAGATPRTVPR